jgi:hypothetical protein
MNYEESRPSVLAVPPGLGRPHRPDRGLGLILGTMLTIGIRAWRRHTVFSTLSGTAGCLPTANAF